MVITAEESVQDEITTCNALFEAGLSKLHVRKPGFSAEGVKMLIQEINDNFLNRLIIHEHHELVQEMQLGGYHIKSNGQEPGNRDGVHVSKSFHTMEEIRSCALPLNYGFLSPVFDSLSKVGYASKFSPDMLKSFLNSPLPFPVYALGGISQSTVSSAKQMGFDGAAVLGSIWQENKVEDRIAKYQTLKQQV